jgi:hypothetical protein
MTPGFTAPRVSRGFDRERCAIAGLAPTASTGGKASRTNYICLQAFRTLRRVIAPGIHVQPKAHVFIFSVFSVGYLGGATMVGPLICGHVCHYQLLRPPD